jgi:3-methyladenine DNA glycosylase AlkD
MTALNEQLRDIKTQLRLSMNGPVSQSMREKGYHYKVNFGVELPRIKDIAAQYAKDDHLAIALWKEDIRECKILASLLMPVENFQSDLAELWVEQIDNIEIAELTVMNLFQHLDYIPSLSFKWIADEREFVQVCGFLTIGRLLTRKGDMSERAANEFLDQAVSACLSDKYNVRRAAMLSLTKYMNSEEHAFKVCRLVEKFKDSPVDKEQALYQTISAQVSE